MRAALVVSGLVGLTLLGCGGSDGTTEQTSTSSAAVSGSNVLHSLWKPVLWTGSVGPEDAPGPGAPPECGPGVNCESFQLKVKLPHGAFKNKNRPGGVQVALRWFGDPGPHQLPPTCPAAAASSIP